MSVRVDLSGSKAAEVMLSLCSLEPERSSVFMDLILAQGDGLVLEIKKARKSHSSQQQRYYRKWLGEFAKFIGYTHDEMHEEMLCRTFGTEYIETKMGDIRRPIKRSSEVGVQEYGFLIDMLIITAAELDYQVPPPT